MNQGLLFQVFDRLRDEDLKHQGQDRQEQRVFPAGRVQLLSLRTIGFFQRHLFRWLSV